MKLDLISLLVTTPVTISLKELEADLQQQGYTLGYLPLRKNTVTLERALRERVPNRYTLKYGEIDDICVAIKVERHRVTWKTKNVPRAATGPDLKKIVIGSRGRYGKIAEATLKVVPSPEKRETLKIRCPKASQKEVFLRKLWGSGVQPLQLEEKRNGFLISLEGMSQIVAAEKEVVLKCVKGALVSEQASVGFIPRESRSER